MLGYLALVQGFVSGGREKCHSDVFSLSFQMQKHWTGLLGAESDVLRRPPDVTLLSGAS